MHLTRSLSPSCSIRVARFHSFAVLRKVVVVMRACVYVRTGMNVMTMALRTDVLCSARRRIVSRFKVKLGCEEAFETMWR